MLDRVHDAFADQSPELIQSSLSGEQEGKLREVFAD